MSPARSADSAPPSRSRSSRATIVRSPAVEGDSRSAAPISNRASSAGRPAASVASATAAIAVLLQPVQHRPAPVSIARIRSTRAFTAQGIRVDPAQPGNRRQISRAVSDQAHHLRAQTHLDHRMHTTNLDTGSDTTPGPETPLSTRKIRLVG